MCQSWASRSRRSCGRGAQGASRARQAAPAGAACACEQAGSSAGGALSARRAAGVAPLRAAQPLRALQQVRRPSRPGHIDGLPAGAWPPVAWTIAVRESGIVSVRCLCAFQQLGMQ
jgi:hypothetical protein